MMIMVHSVQWLEGDTTYILFESIMKADALHFMKHCGLVVKLESYEREQVKHKRVKLRSDHDRDTFEHQWKHHVKTRKSEGLDVYTVKSLGNTHAHR